MGANWELAVNKQALITRLPQQCLFTPFVVRDTPIGREDPEKHYSIVI